MMISRAMHMHMHARTGRYAESAPSSSKALPVHRATVCLYTGESASAENTVKKKAKQKCALDLLRALYPHVEKWGDLVESTNSRQREAKLQRDQAREVVKKSRSALSAYGGAADGGGGAGGSGGGAPDLADAGGGGSGGGGGGAAGGAPAAVSSTHDASKATQRPRKWRDAKGVWQYLDEWEEDAPRSCYTADGWDPAVCGPVGIGAADRGAGGAAEAAEEAAPVVRLGQLTRQMLNATKDKLWERIAELNNEAHGRPVISLRTEPLPLHRPDDERSTQGVDED